MLKYSYAKVVFLLLMSTAVAHAQKFRLGVHATPTFNWVNSSQPDTESGLKVKFAYGLLAEYQFAENYSLLSGIDIMRRGGEFKARDTVGDYSSGFVQLPIALKLRTREFGYLTYFAKFGGAIGFETGERSAFDPDIPEARQLESYVNPFGLTFIFGAGAEYSLGSRSALLLGIDYNRSLFDNLIDNDSRLEEEYTYRFDYVNLTIGFLF